MFVDKSPIQPIPNLRPSPLLKITHLHQIIAPADIRLGAHHPAIRKLPHPVNIGHHHPVIRIHEQLHEPPIHLIRIEITQQHKIAQHHQPLNVMTIPVLQHLFDHHIHRHNPCSSVVKRLRNLPRITPVIAGALLTSNRQIQPPYKFPPTQQLSHKPFHVIQRQVARLTFMQNCIQNILGQQQTIVEIDR